MTTIVEQAFILVLLLLLLLFILFPKTKLDLHQFDKHTEATFVLLHPPAMLVPKEITQKPQSPLSFSFTHHHLPPHPPLLHLRSDPAPSCHLTTTDVHRHRTDQRWSCQGVRTRSDTINGSMLQIHGSEMCRSRSGMCRSRSEKWDLLLKLEEMSFIFWIKKYDEDFSR